MEPNKNKCLKMNRQLKSISIHLIIIFFVIDIFASSLVVAANKSSPRLQTSIYRPTKKVSSPKGSAYDFNALYSPYVSWGISPKEKKGGINLAGAWKKFRKKRSIVIAVIDTGVDPTHPFIKNNIYVRSGRVGSQNYGMDFSYQDPDGGSSTPFNKKKIFNLSENRLKPMDINGHGSHVTGIIKSIFPDAKILCLKYYNPDASGQKNLDSTIEALDYAVKKNVDIINYSGGGPESSKKELRILKEAMKKGILIIAAAGNEKSDIDKKENAYYPASYKLPNIITVTAHDKDADLLSSANYGSKSVDISAPGHRIKSIFPNNQTGFLSGTSQATAFVTGAVALLKSHYPRISTLKIKKIIRSSADKRPGLQNKCISGGILDVDRAMDIAGGRSVKKRNLANRGDSKEGTIIYRYKK